MTELHTTTEQLPTDRPISYRDGQRIVVRIYDNSEPTGRRRRELRTSLKVQGFILQPRPPEVHYETWHLRIRTATDARGRQPISLSDRYGVRYVTPDPSDALIGEVRAGVIKRQDSWEVISREPWVCD